MGRSDTRNNQLRLVSMLTDDSGPNEAMRQLADEFREDVEKGMITRVDTQIDKYRKLIEALGAGR